MIDWFSVAFCPVREIFTYNGSHHFGWMVPSIRPIIYSLCTHTHTSAAVMAQSVRAFVPQAVGWVNPSLDIPKSLKQVATAPLLNARQKVCVPRVLEDDHWVIGYIILHCKTIHYFFFKNIFDQHIVLIHMHCSVIVGFLNSFIFIIFQMKGILWAF